MLKHFFVRLLQWLFHKRSNPVYSIQEEESYGDLPYVRIEPEEDWEDQQQARSSLKERP